jgi:hypothetical protein
VDIWNSKEYQDIRLAHLNCRRREVLLCKDCMEIESAAVDNIDEYREMLLERMTGKQ